MHISIFVSRLRFNVTILLLVSVLFRRTPARIFFGNPRPLVGMAQDSGVKLHSGENRHCISVVRKRSRG